MVSLKYSETMMEEKYMKILALATEFKEMEQECNVLPVADYWLSQCTSKVISNASAEGHSDYLQR